MRHCKWLQNDKCSWNVPDFSGCVSAKYEALLKEVNSSVDHNYMSLISNICFDVTYRKQKSCDCMSDDYDIA